MTPRERAAFAASIAHARELALIAAVSIEIRDDPQALTVQQPQERSRENS